MYSAVISFIFYYFQNSIHPILAHLHFQRIESTLYCLKSYISYLKSEVKCQNVDVTAKGVNSQRGKAEEQNNALALLDAVLYLCQDPEII